MKNILTQQEKNILVAINSFLIKHELHVNLDKTIYQTETSLFDNKDSDVILNKPPIIKYFFILRCLTAPIDYSVWNDIDSLFFNNSDLRPAKRSLFQILAATSDSEVQNFGKTFSQVKSLDELQLCLTIHGYLK